jgi:hypothetical protein
MHASQPNECQNTLIAEQGITSTAKSPAAASAALALLDLFEYVCGDVEDALCGLVTGSTLARFGVVPAHMGR